jgi:1-deoxy-D-xylulose-5-phosphate reductoisomerase
MNSPQRIAILGSTGSVGCSALDVVRSIDGIEVFAISGRSNLERLQQQAAEFDPKYIIAASPSAAAGFEFSTTAKILIGAEHLKRIASDPSVDTVVAAIVGFAGLESALAAVQHGKRLALANKETLVVGGHLITTAAQKSGAEILPVDSEHSAIFQAIACGKRKEVKKIILTASGGPFREFQPDQMQCVTVEQALNHPTWDMGRKISIDSATMMNKALEIIEAKWLFDIDADQIEVIIHPQSLIHSMVTFDDHSTIAQMSPPDMRLPIQYALTWPNRVKGPAVDFDFSMPQQFEFHPPDFDRFPALKLGFEVARSGGSCGAVVNAANEAAVEAFLDRRLSFTDIVSACEEVLEQHNFEPHPTFEQLVAADRWARQEITKWITA